jgi:hypothetical protein
MDAGTDWTGTPVGLALDYDGTNDYVAASANTWAGRDTPQISAVAWVRLTKSGYGTCFFTGYNTAFTWYVGTTPQNLFVGSYTAAPTVGVTVNQWAFIGWSYNTRAIRFWQNAALNGSGAYNAASPLPNHSTMMIGTSSPTASLERWQGQIGEIAIFERALADAEFADLYRRGNGAIGRALTGQTRRRTYGFVAAGFRPYWAARRTQVIGGGVR